MPVTPLGSMASATYARAVTPSANADLPDGTCRAVYVGGSGSLVVILHGDSSTVTFTNVGAGSVLPIQAKAIRTSSTATNILALY